MLLFTRKQLLLKDWLVISRNQHVEFFSPPVNLELVTDCSLNHILFCMQLRMGVFLLHQSRRSVWCCGLKPYVHF